MLQPLLIDGVSVAATPVNLGRIIQDSPGLSKISFRILQGLLLSKGKGDFFGAGTRSQMAPPSRTKVGSTLRCALGLDPVHCEGFFQDF